MKKQVYLEYHNTYEPKHSKKWYAVWRVIGPGGPEEILTVYGLDEARAATKGCWDSEITNYKGEPVK